MTAIPSNEVPSARSELVRTGRRVLRLLVPSVGCWFLTSLVVLAGSAFGFFFVDGTKAATLVDSTATADGRFYVEIARDGYSYDPNHFSNVAFFPAFPLAGRWVGYVAGWEPAVSLLVVANTCYLALFVLTAVYLHVRRPPVPSRAGPAAGRSAGGDPATYTLLALGLVPMTFFFRMPFSEPLFMCSAVLFLIALARRWPLWLTAAIAGFCTSTRPVGIGLLLPLGWQAIWSSANRWQAVRRLAYAMPLGCWGLLAYMAFQFVAFGEPAAFAHVQQVHRGIPFPDKAMSLLSFEPVREAYDVSSLYNWAALSFAPSGLFSMQFQNPIYFVATIAVVIAGFWARWLDVTELLMALSLLAIPYVTVGAEGHMNSQARYAAAVFPAYIVLGRALGRLPTWLAASVLALSAFMLGAYAALFLCNHGFY